MPALALLIVSLAGLVLSIHTAALSRLARWPTLLATPYARVLGVHNSLVAAAYFAGLALFAADRMLGGGIPILLPLAACACSLLMSGYLAWALFVKLRTFCKLCVAGYVLVAAAAAILVAMWACRG